MNEEMVNEFENWWDSLDVRQRAVLHKPAAFVGWQAALASQAKSAPIGFYHKETGKLKSVITNDDGDESDWLDVYTTPQPQEDKVRELAIKCFNLGQLHSGAVSIVAKQIVDKAITEAMKGE